MSFDWIVPHIRCRLVLCPYSIKIVDDYTRWFHQRAVTIDKLDYSCDNKGADIPIALVMTEGKRLWAEYDWLKPLSASAICICPLQRLMAQGCKCGGV